jgi:hypothetical protein
MALTVGRIPSGTYGRGGDAVDIAEMSREWERYGRSLVRSMAEVLNETDPESHPVLLETADYWLSLGLTIGVERSDEAAQLLELIETHEENRAELARDARDFTQTVLR